MTKRHYLTPRQRMDRFLAYQGMCAICSERLVADQYEWDHIQALSRGGTNEIENWQPLCLECHALKTDGRKHNRLGADKFEAAKTKRLLRGKKPVLRKIPSQPFRNRTQIDKGDRT